MCGLAGFFDPHRRLGDDQLQTVTTAMSDRLIHRGPDSGGVWCDAQTGVGLGHRRLAIVDLSPLGHQPMASASGRFVLSFNGEIYNFPELQQALAAQGHTFRGASDTEVMLAAFEEWGLERALARFNGMFAFSLWDRQARTLSIARDRLGEKPLFYGWMAGTFVFGSELKALRAHPDFRAEVDRDALALFLRYNYVPAPYSIYKNVAKLPPGTFLTVGGDAIVKPVAYWSSREAVDRGVAEPFTGAPHEAVGELDALLRDAVQMRMMADVPLGAFLSGGVDSSTVVALMQAQSRRPVQTFSIGFRESGYNEANDAAAVARHLGTCHTELCLTAEDAMGVLPRLPALYDEPFADASQIPTFLVSQLARKTVTVSLSGDGGDELFGGYNRHVWSEGFLRKTRRVPKPARRLVAASLQSFPPQAWDALGDRLPAGCRQRHFGEKMHKVAAVLACRDNASVYRDLVSQWKDPNSIVRGGREHPTLLSDTAHWGGIDGFTRQMMYLDAATYLPDDVLAKVDRASMGVSLEARVPLLDHRVFEFAWRLPLSLKIRDGQSKWVLRQVLNQYVPPALMDRPKMGFAVPIGDWLRGGLRDWAEGLLDEGRLREQGFFHPEPIRRKWTEHLAGRHNWQYPLWSVLMFQSWVEATK